ncbi:hypothetical protein bmyco0003_51630 [Bacillus pseudomycoides]|nr:hypothetical protein bmyco0003_51630 [Bacillus pseudomycoides]
MTIDDGRSEEMMQTVKSTFQFIGLVLISALIAISLVN